MNRLYGYPVFSRAGLGNLLSVWADCLLWCRDNNARMISPTWWLKFHIGPYIRGERDKRNYYRCFWPTDQITGFSKWSLLMFAQRVSAEEWRADGTVQQRTGNTVVCFSDMTQFRRIIGRNAEVASALYRMTRPKFFPRGIGDKPFIGIHVRLGDYPPASTNTSRKLLIFKQPIEWYASCLLEIRRAQGMNLEAIVFSDGWDAELAPLLSLPAVSRSPFRAAITDLLALARSTVLITSRSTFSIWGSYLGQVPSVWFPKKSDICGNGVFAENGSELEIEWKVDDKLPIGFVDAIAKRMCTRLAGPAK